jgi:hypothetical protein
VDWQDRAHFFAVAVDGDAPRAARPRQAERTEKRGGGRVRVELDPERLGDAGVAAEADPDALLALDDALGGSSRRTRGRRRRWSCATTPA